MSNKNKSNLKRNLLICLLAGSAVAYTLPLHAATSVIANNTLPSGGQVVAGQVNIPGWAQPGGTKPTDTTILDITQTGANAVIKWQDFSVGGSATVNFNGPVVENGYNTLNYVNGGNMSQIYGTINANNNGNIYLVNPAGVQIGNSAQINVGSFHASTNYLNEKNLGDFNGTNLNSLIDSNKTTSDAVLMSLGNINASKVTFEGNDRIVIDTERLLTADGSQKLAAANINIVTAANNTGNIVLGYDAYDDKVDEGTGKVIGYKDAAVNDSLATVTTEKGKETVAGYMWVEDVEQLQAINTNLSGNYALRNSIDATGTANWKDNDTDTVSKGFNPLGNEGEGEAFTGKFDGIDYSIFDLTINRADEDNVGLFGYVNNAQIKNVTLTGGSITGKNNVGGVIGFVKDSTTGENDPDATVITNVINSAAVTGEKNVGGIIGSAAGVQNIDRLMNTGKVMSNIALDKDNPTASNVGGLVGSLTGSNLDGYSYNLGDVSGTSFNVGGLVGYAKDSTIGGTGEDDILRNYMNISGAYNVGGIVGSIEKTTVQNVENMGDVAATDRYNTQGNDKYSYHTASGNAPFGQIASGVTSAYVYLANVGGIVGKSTANSEISNVTNTGDVKSAYKNGTFTETGTENSLTYNYYTAGNVGGIVGQAIDTNITNAVNKENDVRGAHNVGGIAGYFGNSSTAKDTYTISASENIGGDIMATGARNQWSEGDGKSNTSQKDWYGFVTESVSNTGEEFIIGNIGGIAGYMQGDNVYITGSTNNGTVHTADPANPAQPQLTEMAANVGGIVGKIDREKTLTYEQLFADNDEKKTNPINAAVSNSFNNGDVRGYTAVGGIAGQMYKGELAAVYNQGTIRSNRQSDTGSASSSKLTDPLNMGGIMGDTTAVNGAGVYIYDAYNEGTIGDAAYVYFGRHVGGVVGRLNGTVEKAYNKGDIYNGYNVVGGIAGWMIGGSNINNAFNSGNITVYNQNQYHSQVGGIVGAAAASTNATISNVYNIGTIRSFAANDDAGTEINENTDNRNTVGGIIGEWIGAYYGSGNLTIRNAYTTGNLYIDDKNEGYGDGNNQYSYLGSIYGLNHAINNYDSSVTTTNTYYIKPDTKGSSAYQDLTSSTNNNFVRDNSNKAIDYADRSNPDSYKIDNNGLTIYKPGEDDKGNVVNDAQYDWRLYEGTTPILNAFLPNAENYFSNNDNMTNIDSIQYGTAYNPMLTIINAAKNQGGNETATTLTFDWEKVGIHNLAGLVVNSANLTIDNFVINEGTGHFNGLIYTDGALTVNSDNGVSLGYRSNLYGASVTINSNGLVDMNGTITAIDGNGAGNVTITGKNVESYGVIKSATAGKEVVIEGIGTTEIANTDTADDIKNAFAAVSNAAERYAVTTGEIRENGAITITAEENAGIYFGNRELGHIDTAGNLTVEAGKDVYIDSDLLVGGDINLITRSADGEIVLDLSNLGQVRKNDYMDALTTALREVGLDINNVTALRNAKETENGQSNIALDAIKALLNEQNPAGADDADGEHKGDNAAVAKRIYNLLAAKNSNGNNLDDADATESKVGELEEEIAAAYMHDFMHDFDNSKEDNDSINVSYKDASGNKNTANDFKIAVDMWDYENNTYDFEKFDSYEVVGTHVGKETHYFKDELNALNISNNGTKYDDKIAITHVWVSDADQLQGIQEYYRETQKPDATKKAEILTFNFALKNDINANWVTDYEAIGTGNDDNGNNIGFAGTFDGRGNRIIGLDATKTSSGGTQDAPANAGIFSAIGSITTKDVTGEVTYTGTVKNVNIYSGVFSGKQNAGAVAGTNEGTIENVTAFGNRVEVTGNSNITQDAKGNVGGVTGINKGTVDNVEAMGTVVAGANVIGGGIIGTNEANAALKNSYSNSAVVSPEGGEGQYGLGGVVGVNEGEVTLVDSLGITNGSAGELNIGGVIGINSGTLTSAYNESIVTGRNQVGGIIGRNEGEYEVENQQWTGGIVQDVVNASSVTGLDFDVSTPSTNVGGLIGTNSGSVTNGRNNAEVTGTNNVGGLIGTNEEDSTLTNLANGESATIVGVKNVGGIAGVNAGVINSDEEHDNLENLGRIYGYTNVGGIAGSNSGTIENVNNDVELFVNTEAVSSGTTPQFFGGVAGLNTGTIGKATNRADVNALGASYVGGVVGQNLGKLQDMAGNYGSVTGGSYVGGVAGVNGDGTGKNNVDLDGVTATNEGTVIATAGGAGGIFAENHGKVINSTLRNDGIVAGSGAGGTGGIFGVNYGDVDKSSLRNEVGGTVIGASSVGGLIGINYGKVTGGRATDAEGKDLGYYAYQIYNNGTVIAGKWVDSGTDGKADGVFDVSEITKIPPNSSNIGGLIGYNAKDEEANKTGSLTAAYNTGVVDAANSTNVGGVVGNNAGTVDQVFNTVMIAKDATDITGAALQAEIKGNSNVGGVVGSNSGTLTNAYNTSAVSGNTNKGNIVGSNAETGTISNVYATNTTGKLIGSNENTAKGAITSAYTFVEVDDDTTVNVIADVYGQKQSGSYVGFDFDGTDDTAAIWKNYDGYSNPLLKVFLTTLTVDGNKVDLVYNAGEQDLNLGALVDDKVITAPTNGSFNGLDAYNNTLLGNENTLGESHLLANTKGQQNAGVYSDWLYSAQIHQTTTDGAEFNPNNLGYDVVYKNLQNADGNQTDESGIKINKAQISITLDDISRVYGNLAITNNTADSFKNDKGYGYTYAIANGGLSDVMQKELEGTIGFKVTTDGALINGHSLKKTQKVGEYDWAAEFAFADDSSGLASNYEFVTSGSTVGSDTLTVNNGKSFVNKAQLTIIADSASTAPGVMPHFTGTVTGLTNGDKMNYSFNLDRPDRVHHIKHHNGVVGITIDGKYYEVGYNWNNSSGILSNYNVEYKVGDLTVTTDLVPTEPDYQWNYLFNDHPFDRNRNFRERKAEVNYIDGGMEI